MQRDPAARRRAALPPGLHWGLAVVLLVAVAAPTSLAETDLAGLWRPLARNQDGSGMIGDLAGMPVSAAGRWRAESWSPDDFDTAEWACRPHAWDYSLEGPLSALRFWPDVDGPTQDLVAYHGHINQQEQETTIWMDGRPHPPANALHTWSGFSTGEWEGDTLVVTTTHLKEAYIRRWGAMRSDRAVVRTRWRRIGDYLQATSILYDPIYQAEPYVRTTMMWAHDPSLVMSPYPCEEATEIAFPRGTVPHYLPGKSVLPSWNPKGVDRFTTPYDARLGGPETTYPEYIATMKAAAAATPRPASTAVQASASQRGWTPVLKAPAPGEIEVLPVQGNVFMISGAGANITVHAGDEGILLVDTGTAAMSEKVWAAIHSISQRPLRYIVNTAEHADHTGGNSVIGAKGQIIPLRDRTYTAGPQGSIQYNRASIVAYLTVLNRMSAPTGEVAPTPEAGWPDNTYATPQKRLHFNGEPIVITHELANTDGNSVVLFRKSDVVSAGDLIDLTGFPLIDVKAGGSIRALVQGLNHLIDITVPEAHAAGGTLVVPGHGRIADHAEVAYYRDMVTIVRDRMADMIGRGMTLEQVKAAHPAREYEPRYGRSTGAWTTDMFIEAAYRTLAKGTN
jgi:cyclase